MLQLGPGHLSKDDDECWLTRRQALADSQCPAAFLVGPWGRDRPIPGPAIREAEELRWLPGPGGSSRGEDRLPGRKWRPLCPAAPGCPCFPLLPGQRDELCEKPREGWWAAGRPAQVCWHQTKARWAAAQAWALDLLLVCGPSGRRRPARSAPSPGGGELQAPDALAWGDGQEHMCPLTPPTPHRGGSRGTSGDSSHTAEQWQSWDCPHPVGWAIMLRPHVQGGGLRVRPWGPPRCRVCQGLVCGAAERGPRRAWDRRVLLGWVSAWFTFSPHGRLPVSCALSNCFS